MARSATLPLLAVCMLYALSGCVAADTFLGLSLETLLRGSAGLDSARFRRIVGGTSVSGCNYPGAVALTISNYVFCMGIRKAGGIVRTPKYCYDTLKTVNGFLSIDVYGGDGTSKVSVAPNGLTATASSDVWTEFSVPAFSGSTCSSDDATLFTSGMDIDTSTCRVVSYGSTTSAAAPYNVASPTLLATSLQTVPYLSCCSTLMTNLLSEAEFGQNKDVRYVDSYTCVKTSNGTCTGDVGAPIYCMDRTSSKNVVVALLASGRCDLTGSDFNAIDFTNRNLVGFSA